MNHAIFIKPKTVAQSFFTLSFTAPSFQFEYHYYPAILVSASTRGVFHWTNGKSSEVNTLTGPLGSFYPTQMMLTKKLHDYGKFQHNYELVIKHNVENGVGQHNIFFVFFLQGRNDAPENALDLFLQKKTTLFDAAAFLNPSFSERSNNAYYTSAKTKDHVFLFPKVISVKNDILRSITGTPKPATQIYREILLSEHVSESNRIPIEYDKEQIIDPVSTDILVSLVKPKEGFKTPETAIAAAIAAAIGTPAVAAKTGDVMQTCYPIDENDKTYSQVVIGTGSLDDSGRQNDALEDTQMSFAYAVLTISMFVIIVPLANIVATMSIGIPVLQGVYIFLCVAFLAIGIALPTAKLHQKHKEGRDKNMHLSASSANIIGLTFLMAFAFMFFPQRLLFRGDDFHSIKPYLMSFNNVDFVYVKDELNRFMKFVGWFFPIVHWNLPAVGAG